MLIALLFTSLTWANNAFDITAQSLLEWKDPKPAQHLSDILQTSLILTPLVTSAFQKEPLKTVGISAGVMATNIAVTTILKHLTDRERPNGENNLSFPSGHTSSAFAGATLACFHVDKVTCGVLYSMATITGYLRIAGSKHWLTDVLFGAGIGYANGYFIPTLGFSW